MQSMSSSRPRVLRGSPGLHCHRHDRAGSQAKRAEQERDYKSYNSNPQTRASPASSDLRSSSCPRRGSKRANNSIPIVVVKPNLPFCKQRRCESRAGYYRHSLPIQTPHVKSTHQSLARSPRHSFPCSLCRAKQGRSSVRARDPMARSYTSDPQQCQEARRPAVPPSSFHGILWKTPS